MAGMVGTIHIIYVLVSYAHGCLWPKALAAIYLTAYYVWGHANIWQRHGLSEGIHLAGGLACDFCLAALILAVILAFTSCKHFPQGLPCWIWSSSSGFFLLWRGRGRRAAIFPVMFPEGARPIIGGRRPCEVYSHGSLGRYNCHGLRPWPD